MTPSKPIDPFRYVFKCAKPWSDWSHFVEVGPDLEGLRDEVKADVQNHEGLFRIGTKWQRECQAIVTLELWFPDACQGGIGERIHLAYGPPRDVVWSRNAKEYNTKILIQDRPSRQQMFAKLFDYALSLTGKDKIVLANLATVSVKPLIYAIQKAQVTKLDFSETYRDKLAHFQNAYICACLLQTSQSLRHVSVETSNERHKGYQGLPSKAIHHVLKSTKGNTSLKRLDLHRSRYIHTWGRDGCYQHDKISAVSLRPLMISLPQKHITHMDLSGVLLKESSLIRLVKGAIPESQLQELLLRNVGLKEKGLVAVFSNLQKCKSLVRLDVSHHSFTPKVVKALIRALGRDGSQLEHLITEHCDLDYEEAKRLAKALPSFRGLRSWFLNGNTFCSCLPREHEDEESRTSSLGALALAKALKKNTSLVKLEMGSSWFSSRPCCTGPRYHLFLSEKRKATMKSFLDRNEEAYYEYRRERMCQSVVHLAILLLEKLSNESSAA